MLVVAIAAASLIVYLYIATFSTETSTNHDHWGLFGDYLGGVLGTVIAILTLIAVFYALWLQANILVTTREELSETLATMRTQKEESAFFQLLDNYRKILDSVSSPEGAAAEQKYGVNALFIANRHFLTVLDNPLNRLRDLEPEGIVRLLSNNLTDSLIYSHTSQYVRTVAGLLDFLGTLDEHSRSRYLSIFASAVSPIEQLFLIYYCIGASGSAEVAEILNSPLIQDIAMPQSDIREKLMAAYAHVGGTTIMHSIE